MSINKLFTIFFTLYSFVFLSSCSTSGTEVESNLGFDDAPDWVNEGSQALSNDEGRLIHGVGEAADVANFSLQKNTADNRARAEVASVLGTFMENVSYDYAGHSQNNNEVDISRIIKTKNNLLMSGVRIIARWKQPKTNRLFSLAELNMEQTKQVIESLNQFPNNFKNFVSDNSDDIFDNYTKMGK